MNLETARIPTFTAARQRLVYTGLSGYRPNNGRVLYQIPLCVAWEFCYNRPPYKFPSFEMGEDDMKIKDILAQERPSVSFEVFPPRKDAPFEPVKDAVAQLAQERPSFMSVTYGASGNAQANTVAIASFVQACGVPALAHLTCVASTLNHLGKKRFRRR